MQLGTCPLPSPLASDDASGTLLEVQFLVEPNGCAGTYQQLLTSALPGDACDPNFGYVQKSAPSETNHFQ